MSSDASYENGRLIITRVFDAPREAVFDAWIQTSKVKLWWGCQYTVDVNSEIEPKVGGKFSHQMTLKNVGDYLHHGLITEYEPPKLLAYQLTDQFTDGIMFVRVEFIEEDSRTRVRLTQDNLPDTYSQYVIAGWSAGFDKLATFLEKTKSLSR